MSSGQNTQLRVQVAVYCLPVLLCISTSANKLSPGCDLE